LPPAQAKPALPPVVAPPVPAPVIAPPAVPVPPSSTRVLPVQAVDRNPASSNSIDDLIRDFFAQDVPSTDALFSRLDSEKMLEQRMRQQSIQRSLPVAVKFPEHPPLTRDAYVARAFPPGTMFAEPNFVNYRRLYFQQVNLERYGWDLGFITPFVSVATFYKDVLFLPQHYATQICRRWDTSAGYCLPGDPVPFILYPPQIAVSGSVAEAAVVIGLIAMFHGL
jgi:hypothetical protein